MNHIKNIDEQKTIDNTIGDIINSLMQSSIEGKDLIKIIGSKQININVRSVHLKANQYIWYINKTTENKWKVGCQNQHENTHTFDKIESAFRCVWVLALKKAIAPLLDSEFLKWIGLKNCEARGKELRPQEIYNLWNEQRGLYIPQKEDIVEFFSQSIKDKLNLQFTFRTGTDTSICMENINPNTTIIGSIRILMDPLEGTLKPLFEYLAGLSSPFNFPVIIEVEGSIDGFYFLRKDRSACGLFIGISSTNKEEYFHKLKIELTKYFHSNKCNIYLKLVGSILLDNEKKIRKNINFIWQDLKEKNESMGILSHLRLNAPDIFQIIEDMDSNTNLSADLGDYGF